MPFSAGQTFLFPLGGPDKAHLWIICTDPDPSDMFVVVSITSLRGSKDQTVILRSGEHPFIRWDSCVFYQLADLIDSHKLSVRLACREARMHDVLNPSLLRLVQDGFTASQFTKNRLIDYMRKIKQPRS